MMSNEHIPVTFPNIKFFQINWFKISFFIVRQLIRESKIQAEQSNKKNKKTTIHFRLNNVKSYSNKKKKKGKQESEKKSEKLK